MTKPDWYLPLGQPLAETHAIALRDAFGDEVIRLGREVMDRVRYREPSASPEGELFSVRALVHSYRFPRGERDAGIALGMVLFNRGFWKVIPIGLDWETGFVSVLDREWAE